MSDVAATTPLAALRQRAQAAPSAMALVDYDGRRWTRAALLADAEAAMEGLRARGFRAGDRVLFSVRPGARALALALAVHELAAVLVPQDPGVGDELFRARIERLAPRWVFAEGVLLSKPGSLAAAALRVFGLRWAPLGEIAAAQYISVGLTLPGAVTSTSYDALLAAGRARTSASEDGAVAAPDAEALLVHTSGSTASPRIVVHTRRSLAAILAAVADGLALSESDVVYARDLHLLLPALTAGAVAVVPPKSAADPATLLQTFTRWRVTHAFLVTRDCRNLVEHAERNGSSLPASLRQLMIGAAPVRSGFLARLRPLLPEGCTAWCVYGATEALPISRVSLDEKLAWQGDGDLVGAPIPGLELRIREDGQLAVRGERCCSGYLGEPPLQEVASGDIARLDDGRIVLLGRAKDMIIRGEHNIYPELYEPAIERIPGVRRAAMLGDFNPETADERVLLVIEAEAGEHHARLHRRVATALSPKEGRIDAAAIPDVILFRPLPESGRSGKIDKAALRQSLGLRSPIR